MLQDYPRNPFFSHPYLLQHHHHSGYMYICCYICFERSMIVLARTIRCEQSSLRITPPEETHAHASHKIVKGISPYLFARRTQLGQSPLQTAPPRPEFVLLQHYSRRIPLFHQASWNTHESSRLAHRREHDEHQVEQHDHGAHGEADDVLHHAVGVFAHDLSVMGVAHQRDDREGNAD